MKDKRIYIYILEKLNGLRLSSRFAGDKFKRFHSWQQLHFDYAPDLDFEKLPNLNNFLVSNGNSNLFDVPDDIFDI